jgi:hypothetical protein
MDYLLEKIATALTVPSSYNRQDFFNSVVEPEPKES